MSYRNTHGLNDLHVDSIPIYLKGSILTYHSSSQLVRAQWRWWTGLGKIGSLLQGGCSASRLFISALTSQDGCGKTCDYEWWTYTSILQRQAIGEYYTTGDYIPLSGLKCADPRFRSQASAHGFQCTHTPGYRYRAWRDRAWAGRSDTNISSTRG